MAATALSSARPVRAFKNLPDKSKEERGLIVTSLPIRNVPRLADPAGGNSSMGTHALPPAYVLAMSSITLELE